MPPAAIPIGPAGIPSEPTNGPRSGGADRSDRGASQTATNCRVLTIRVRIRTVDHAQAVVR
jgi:hypothetical protein